MTTWGKQKRSRLQPVFSAATVFVILWLEKALCATFSETVDSLEPWKFTHRFCFTPTPDSIPLDESVEVMRQWGLFQYEVMFRVADKPSLLVYYDSFNSWDKVYSSNLTCSERRAEASAEIRLWTRNPRAIQGDANAANYDTMATGYVIFRATHDTFFFITAANCEQACTGAFCEAPLQLTYTFQLTNGDDSDRHFSADAAGSLEMAAVFATFYSVLSLVAALVAWALKRKGKYHKTVRLLVNSINVQMVAVYCQVIDLSWFAQRGVGLPGFALAAVLLSIAAEMMLLLLLILMAKGWTIVRRKISGNGRTKIAVFMTMFVVLSLVTQLWALYKFDEASTAVYYESPPGALLIAFRFMIAIWFAYAGSTTFRNYRAKRSFYAKFITVFVAWLVLVPVMLGVSVGIGASHRARFALAWALLYPALAHSALLALYNPTTRCNRSFPFHAHTNDMMLKKTPLDGALAQKAARAALSSNALTAVPAAENPADGWTLRPSGALATSSAQAAGGGITVAGRGGGGGGGAGTPLLDPGQVFLALRAEGRALADGLLRLQPAARDLDALVRELEGEEEDRDEDLEEDPYDAMVRQRRRPRQGGGGAGRGRGRGGGGGGPRRQPPWRGGGGRGNGGRGGGGRGGGGRGGGGRSPGWSPPPPGASGSPRAEEGSRQPAAF